MSDTWYRDPRANETYPRGVLAMLVDEIVAALLDQITERHCPWCERLTGYAHADWTAPALIHPWCGRYACLMIAVRARRAVWESMQATRRPAWHSIVDGIYP